MLRLLFVCLFYSPLTFATDETSKDQGRYYRMLENVQAPTYVVGPDKMLHPSGVSALLNQGSFIQVDRIGKDGTLWMQITSGKKNEWVAVPSEHIEHGKTWLGETVLSGYDQDWLKGFTEYNQRVDNVRPLAVGRANKIGRYIGRLGREDAEVYLESDTRNRMILLKDPKGNSNICTDQMYAKKECTGPTTEDPMRIIDTTVSYNLDRATGDFKPSLFYKVETTYCPNGTVEACNGSTKKEVGWVEAKRVGITRRPAITGGSNILRRPYSSPVNCPDGHQRQLNDLVHGISITEDEFDREVFSKVGECVGEDYVNKALRIKNDLIQKSNQQHGGEWNAELSSEYKSKLKELGNSNFNPNRTPFNLLRQHWNNKPRDKVSHNELTNEQLFAIDSLARSLYGEMRGCADKSSAYYQVVARAIMNRSAICKDAGPTKPFIKQENAPVKNQPLDKIIPYVVSSDQQISSWNPWDSNLKDNLCPQNREMTPEQMAAWRSAVNVAWQAVRYRTQFLEDTKTITHTHYFSPNALENGKSQPDWAVGKKMDVGFKIGENHWGDPDCIVLVQDAYNKKIEDLRRKNPKSFSRLDGVEINFYR